jgi:NADPH:quinone reductase-like Zn-dependent oxidoreductase
MKEEERREIASHMTTPRALWITGPGRAELRPAALVEGEVEVETLYSGISRGTEALVFRGEIPESEWTRMRCPLQEGEFPFPVKYGYAAVGIVRRGPSRLEGRTVFVLHPHQDRFAAPEAMAIPLPDCAPPGRAVLAANMETALNIVWDAEVAPGDRIAVIGAGVVGALAATLCAAMPGAEVTLVDVNPARAALAAILGCAFAGPETCPTNCDVVIHASATSAGLTTALAAAGVEARVVEASWYGTHAVAAPLGESFHSRRLAIIASQVGLVPASRRARWTTRRRLETALRLLDDDRLDALISAETRFDDLPADYGAILADPATLCHRIRY